MLRNRLLFGTLMTVLFTGIVIFDGWLDGSLTFSTADDKPVQGTIFCILISLIAVPSQLEMSKLAATKNLKIFVPISIAASILFATCWYWQQLIEISLGIYLIFLSAFVLLALLLWQYISYGASGVLANCGANYFSIMYLGLLGGFSVGIRIKFGLWPLLMFIFVVKCSDIGAYAIGTLFGKHKFSPRISPLKTWEGMGGAVATAVIVAISFAAGCDIMGWWPAIIFGCFFAFISQISDLAESMMKRDAEQKDSANPDYIEIPGFGGILDIIDSLLVTAPFAYLFFMYGII